MPRTNGYLPLLFLFSLILGVPAFSQSQDEKAKAVDQQLDMQANLQNSGQSSQEDADLKSGDMEKQFPGMQVDEQKEFSSLQADEQKEFPNIQADEQKEFPSLQVDSKKEFIHS